MVGRKQTRKPVDLARAKTRFAAWRRTRNSGSRIPDPLWAAAVELVAIHGLHRTASTLGLDYYSLKKRADSAQASGDAAAAFIELAPTLPVPSECVIEFDDGAGSTMRIHLKGSEAPDLIALARNFWSGE